MRSGESVKEILSYWLPEFISVAILFSMPPIIDALLVASLKSTTTFGALGMASNFLHTLIKLAEAIPVAAIAIIGRHNGAKEYKECGRALGDTFWTTFLLGFTIFCLVFFNAGFIYRWLGVPENMIAIGVPFLRLRSIGILLTFMFFAFIGFMKGVKNTRVPMIINIIGTIVFVACDYVFILGKCGFPAMRLSGSALATLIQFTIMNAIAIGYILLNSDYAKYFQHAFFMMFNPEGAWRIIKLSLPIMIDKSSLSFAYIWLSKMIAPMGKYAIATMDTIKHLERFAFIPALGFASIITFLVSNRIGAQDHEGARANVKKVLLLSVAMVATTVFILCTNAPFFISFFDPRGKFLPFAAPILPVVSSLVVFDLVQVVLAGSLRGAGDVKTVMLGRFCVVFGVFVPLAYGFSLLPIQDQSVRFTLIYSSFYMSNAVMGFIFLKRVMGDRWYKGRIE